MKKTMAVLMGVALAGVAMADISVNFKEGSKLVLKAGETAPGPTTILAPGSLVQLVWSATAPAGGDIDLSLARAGEVILATATGTAGGQWAGANSVYGDAAVGGAINAGYFWARLFSGTGLAGDSFLEMGVQSSTTPGTLKSFSALDPTSAYDSNMNDLPAFTAIDAQGVTVIPEPATLGLMGIAGLGMFLARKKVRR